MSMTKTAEEKPDFHALAFKVVDSFEDRNFSEHAAVKAGMLYVWNMHAAPLKKRIEELEFGLLQLRSDFNIQPGGFEYTCEFIDKLLNPSTND